MKESESKKVIEKGRERKERKRDCAMRNCVGTVSVP